MIRNEPDIEICGIRLKDYYKKHILRACTKEDKVYVGSYEDMQSLTGRTDPFRTFQQTVETSALVIGLQACREQIWMSYTQKEKDCIASLLSGFAHGNTVPQNWRFFNMLDLAFLYKEGYEIDKEIMVDHAQALLNYTVGDGWYRDGQSFDYYSCWAFNIYAPIGMVMKTSPIWQSGLKSAPISFQEIIRISLTGMDLLICGAEAVFTGMEPQVPCPPISFCKIPWRIPEGQEGLHQALCSSF